MRLKKTILVYSPIIILQANHDEKTMKNSFLREFYRNIIPIANFHVKIVNNNEKYEKPMKNFFPKQKNGQGENPNRFATQLQTCAAHHYLLRQFLTNFVRYKTESVVIINT